MAIESKKITVCVVVTNWNLICCLINFFIAVYIFCRMIVAGQLVNHVARNKVEIFRFDLEYSLTSEMTVQVSDHYPISLVVQSKLL